MHCQCHSHGLLWPFCMSMQLHSASASVMHSMQELACKQLTVCKASCTDQPVPIKVVHCVQDELLGDQIVHSWPLAFLMVCTACR